MKITPSGIKKENNYNLERFTDAQSEIYGNVVYELKNGQKKTHWIWFIFPQIDGLGHSSTAKYYAIKNAEEAKEYLRHPVLKERLTECIKAVLAVEGKSIRQILGTPDDLKLKSSMTLFASVENQDPIFKKVIDKYFDGKYDDTTIRLLRQN